MRLVCVCVRATLLPRRASVAQLAAHTSTSAHTHTRTKPSWRSLGARAPSRGCGAADDYYFGPAEHRRRPDMNDEPNITPYRRAAGRPVDSSARDNNSAGASFFASPKAPPARPTRNCANGLMSIAGPPLGSATKWEPSGFILAAAYKLPDLGPAPSLCCASRRRRTPLCRSPLAGRARLMFCKFSAASGAARPEGPSAKRN